MKSREVMKVSKDKGWYIRRISGSHHHFKHGTILGLITVPHHSTEDLSPATLHNIMKMAQLSEKDFSSKKYKKTFSYKVLGVRNAITDSY